MPMQNYLKAVVVVFLSLSPAFSQQLAREQWGGMPVTVSHRGNEWIIAGKVNSIAVNQSNLGLTIKAGETTWTMKPSIVGDMLVNSNGKNVALRLADAKKIDIVPYDTGF